MRPVLRLTCEDGNAYAILGKAARALRAAGRSDADVMAFTREASRGDYDHLLATCMRWFEVE